MQQNQESNEVISINSRPDELSNLIQAPQAGQAASPSAIAKVVSYGLNNSLVAIHLIGNGILLSSLGPNEAAAAGLINSLQAVINGSVVGVLLNSGYMVGKALGEDVKGSVACNTKIGSIVKTGWLIGFGLSAFSTASFLALKKIMPLIVDAPVGEAVGDFFLMFAIGSFSEPLGASNGMLIGRLEEGVFIPLAIPFLSMALYRLPALGLGYWFAVPLEMGAKGVGLGSAVAGIGSFLATQLWFSRNTFKNYQLYSLAIPDFKKHVLSYLSGGWKLSLQRLSEWGNIASITLLVGIWSKYSLSALQPAVQANFLVAISLQGMGQAAMMFISTDCKQQQKIYQDFLYTPTKEKLDQFLELKNANRSTFFKNNAAGLVLSTALAGGVYFWRDPVINLFLKDAPSAQYDLAESLLFYNLISLIPDAVRIVSGGILRGWDDLLFPTLMSLLLMTVLGVGIGGAVSYFEDENILPIFWARIAGITLSAAVNCYKFYRHMNDDNDKYLAGLRMLGLPENDNEIENIEDERTLPVAIKPQGKVLPNESAATSYGSFYGGSLSSQSSLKSVSDQQNEFRR